MTNELLTLDKAPFIAIALSSFFASLRYFEDLRKLDIKSTDYNHAFKMFVTLLCISIFSAGYYVALFNTDGRVKNTMVREQNKQSAIELKKGVALIKDEVNDKQYVQFDIDELLRHPDRAQEVLDMLVEIQNNKEVSWDGAKKKLREAPSRRLKNSARKPEAGE
jgi:hypothetical protein